LGLKAACVEMRGRLGGTCLNVGCIPSKALLTSSHHYHDAKNHLGDHGIVINGDVSIDVGKMLETKEQTVERLTGGIEFLMKKYGVDYIRGKGSLAGPNAVAVERIEGESAQTLETKNVLIATGSEVTPLPPVPVDNAAGKIVDSTGALDISAVPETMAVIGGGVIGLEMGSVWSRLGAKVTVIEFLDKICPAMDTELTKNFQKALKKQKFKFKLKTKVTKSEVTDEGVKLTTESTKNGKESEDIFDVVLVATGRRPYTKALDWKIWESKRTSSVELMSMIISERLSLIFTPLETASMDPCLHTRPKKKALPPLKPLLDLLVTSIMMPFQASFTRIQRWRPWVRRKKNWWKRA